MAGEVREVAVGEEVGVVTGGVGVTTQLVNRKTSPT